MTDAAHPDEPDQSAPGDPIVKAEEVLERAKEVSRRITERVRRATSGGSSVDGAPAADPPPPEGP